MKNVFQGWTLVTILTLFFFLFLGLAIYRDYGLGWDEPNQRFIGKSNFNYLIYGNRSLFNIGDRYYGPFYETILYALTNSPASDQEYYARHWVQFLTFFAGTIVFLLLVYKLWKKAWLAWIGWLMLVLSPRIFADAFYNSKDIPFMIAFISAVYTLIRYLDHPSWKNLVIHVLCSAVLIAIRIPGILIIVMTAGFILLDLIADPARSWRNLGNRSVNIAVYIILSTGLVILFWPILWHDPVKELAGAFQQMSRYPNTITALYKGYLLAMSPPPSSYIPTWIAITTPILYLAGFLAGLISVAVRFLRRPVLANDVEKRNLLVLLVWFFVPIAVVILMGSSLYNGWRQMYFVYPPLILIALQGLLDLTHWISRLSRPHLGRWILGGVIFAGLLDPISFMIRSHPDPYIYFNKLAGASLAQVKYYYEMDYWGLSSKAALDFILRTDLEESIPVYCDEPTAQYNSLLLPESQRDRLIFTEDIEQARYFIGKYRNHPEDYPYPNEVFSVTVDGAKLASVFKLR